jgi:LmbE family N-acetylglucosaminyl deacetylase
MTLFEGKKRILVLAPHTDDGEFGCGATIAKEIEAGSEVYYAAFSACEQSVLPQFPSDILIREVGAATRVLGIPVENMRLFKYDVRTFEYHRQAILDDMLRLRETIRPDLVFIPSLRDVHQDHGTVANEAVRAFKFTSMLSYELPWNNFNFNTACFVKLEERHIATKVAALMEYRSQAHRSYANEEFIRSLARTRGVQVNTQYAEVFEVVRWIIE